MLIFLFILVAQWDTNIRLCDVFIATVESVLVISLYRLECKIYHGTPRYPSQQVLRKGGFQFNFLCYFPGDVFKPFLFDNLVIGFVWNGPPELYKAYFLHTYLIFSQFKIIILFLKAIKKSVILPSLKKALFYWVLFVACAGKS